MVETQPQPVTSRWFNLEPRQCRWGLALLLLGLGLVRLVHLAHLPLAEDETHYWQWSRHLAWGYFDQGPLVAWMVRLGTELLGSNPVGVRITAWLASLAMTWLLYDFCRRVLKDEPLGLLLALAANATLLFTVGSIIHTYDTHQALWWLATLYFAGLALFAQRPAAWYGAGLALGLSMLAKYSSALLPLLIMGFLITSPGQRFWLRRKEPWLAALLAGLVFLPNLIWNAQHHWCAFAFTLGKTGGGTWKFTAFDFLGAQAALVGPIFLVMMAPGLVLAWRQARQGSAVQAFLLWTSLPVLVIFFLLSFKTRIQGNWPAPGYLAALPAVGLAIKQKLIQSRLWRRWAAAGLIMGLLVVAAAHLHAPLMGALGVPPRLDPTKKLHGWQGLGPAIAQELAAWPGGDKPFLFGLRYQLACLTAYYTPGQPRVEGLFLPNSKLNSYLFWTDPAALKGRDGLGVVYGNPPLDQLFERVTLLRALELKGPTGAVLHRLNLFRCEGFKGKDFRPDWARADR